MSPTDTPSWMETKNFVIPLSHPAKTYELDNYYKAFGNLFKIFGYTQFYEKGI